jgi:hypothetical protein
MLVHHAAEILVRNLRKHASFPVWRFVPRYGYSWHSLSHLSPISLFGVKESMVSPYKYRQLEGPEAE